MKLKSILLALLLVVIASTMAGCDLFSKKDTIVGTWEYVSGRPLYYFSDTRSFEISENGTIREFTYNESGTYTVSEDTLIVVAQQSGTETFRFVLDGDNLTLIDRDGDSATYRRSNSAGNSNENNNNNNENNNNSENNNNNNNNNQNASVVGHWQRVSGRPLYYFSSTPTFEISSNGSIVEHEYGENATWSISGNYIVITAPISGTESFTFSVSADGNTLTLIDRDGDTAIYSRSSSESTNNNTAASRELIGTWQRNDGRWLYFFGDEERIVFGSNSTVTVGSSSGTWTGSASNFRVQYGDESRTENFTYSINGNTLLITDSANDTSTYTRVS